MPKPSRFTSRRMRRGPRAGVQHRDVAAHAVAHQVHRSSPASGRAGSRGRPGSPGTSSCRRRRFRAGRNRASRARSPSGPARRRPPRTARRPRRPSSRAPSPAAPARLAARPTGARGSAGGGSGQTRCGSGGGGWYMAAIIESRCAAHSPLQDTLRKGARPHRCRPPHPTRPERPARHADLPGHHDLRRAGRRADAHAILDRALERGIDFIDTAEMYAVPTRARDLRRHRNHHRQLVRAQPRRAREARARDQGRRPVARHALGARGQRA